MSETNNQANPLDALDRLDAACQRIYGVGLAWVFFIGITLIVSAGLVYFMAPAFCAWAAAWHALTTGQTFAWWKLAIVVPVNAFTLLLAGAVVMGVAEFIGSTVRAVRGKR